MKMKKDEMQMSAPKSNNKMMKKNPQKQNPNQTPSPIALPHLSAELNQRNERQKLEGGENLNEQSPKSPTLKANKCNKILKKKADDDEK